MVLVDREHIVLYQTYIEYIHQSNTNVFTIFSTIKWKDISSSSSSGSQFMGVIVKHWELFFVQTKKSLAWPLTTVAPV